jgi:putative pyruvate formate lyase activating enzyme
VKDYPQVNQAALLEMQRQVGDLQLDAHGIAIRGLLVRHLVLPNGLAGSQAILAFLSEKVSKQVYVNIMAQYHPAYRADEFPALNRRITQREYQQVVHWAQERGLTRLDQR